VIRDHLYAGFGGFFCRVAYFVCTDGIALAVLEQVILHLAKNQTLIHQPHEWLGCADVTQIEQHLVPEARVQQVQHRVLDAADVEIDRHPISLLAGIDEAMRILRIAISQVIPA
jgi:hypothetical protein